MCGGPEPTLYLAMVQRRVIEVVCLNNRCGTLNQRDGRGFTNGVEGVGCSEIESPLGSRATAWKSILLPLAKLAGPAISCRRWQLHVFAEVIQPRGWDDCRLHCYAPERQDVRMGEISVFSRLPSPFLGQTRAHSADKGECKPKKILTN